MTTDFKNVLKLSVPVIVQIGRRQMSLDEVLAMGPGAIVDLNRGFEGDLDILVNNKSVGRGVAVKVGENFGVRVTNIAEPQERIEAMGR
jgi:flagellar motor switch protein FliN/FliY